MPNKGILSLLFGKKKKKRGKKKARRKYGNYSKSRPKGLTKSLVKQARRHKLKVTVKVGGKRRYKTLRRLKSQLNRKKRAKKKRDARRRRAARAAFGSTKKTRRKTTTRRKTITRRVRRVNHFGIGYGPQFQPLMQVAGPYPVSITGPPYAV